MLLPPAAMTKPLRFGKSNTDNGNASTNKRLTPP
jgi:hypothetical protein